MDELARLIENIERELAMEGAICEFVKRLKDDQLETLLFPTPEVSDFIEENIPSFDDHVLHCGDCGERAERVLERIVFGIRQH